MTNPSLSVSQSEVADFDTLSQQIDWEHLHQLSDHNTEFEWELLEIFARDSVNFLDSLKPAIAAHNYQDIEQKAHHIKGASANVGVTTMQRIATELEQYARTNQLEDGDRLMQDLEVALNQVIALLRKHTIAAGNQVVQPD